MPRQTPGRAWLSCDVDADLAERFRESAAAADRSTTAHLRHIIKAAASPPDADRARPQHCACRRPARSPRANGPDECMVCRRPIRADGFSSTAPACVSADAPTPPDDLSDLGVEQPLPAVPPAMARAGSPRTCRCERAEPWRNEDGEVRCRKCGQAVIGGQP